MDNPLVAVRLEPRLDGGRARRPRVPSMATHFPVASLRAAGDEPATGSRPRREERWLDHAEESREPGGCSSVVSRQIDVRRLLAPERPRLLPWSSDRPPQSRSDGETASRPADIAPGREREMCRPPRNRMPSVSVTARGCRLGRERRRSVIVSGDDDAGGSTTPCPTSSRRGEQRQMSTRSCGDGDAKRLRPDLDERSRGGRVIALADGRHPTRRRLRRLDRQPRVDGARLPLRLAVRNRRRARDRVATRREERWLDHDEESREPGGCQLSVVDRPANRCPTLAGTGAAEALAMVQRPAAAIAIGSRPVVRPEGERDGITGHATATTDSPSACGAQPTTSRAVSPTATRRGTWLRRTIASSGTTMSAGRQSHMALESP